MKNKHFFTAVIVSSVILLTACGGGGSSSGNTGGSGGSSGGTGIALTLAAIPAISPANGANNVDYSAQLTFTASETLSSARIKLTCDGVNVVGTTTVSGAVATFTPMTTTASTGYAALANCVGVIVAADTVATSGDQFISDTALSNFSVRPLICPTSVSASTAPVISGTAMVAVCSNVFVEAGTPKNQYPVIVSNVNAALQTNINFYGSLLADTPDVYTCYSSVCASYFGTHIGNNFSNGPGTFQQFTTARQFIVITSPYWGDTNVHVLAHELSHIEVYKRTNGIPVNAWFNEGLATFIGQQFNCTGVANGVNDLTQLNVQIDWNNYTGADSTIAIATYCQAEAEVSQWIAQHGGSNGVIQLLNGLNQGGDFFTLYGPL